MTNLLIEETLETPEINFNSESGILKISGRAYSSDISLFYKNIEAWLEEYIQNPKESTIIELHLDYYNSVFHKLLFNFLKKGKTLTEKGKELAIKWFYQEGDEDSEEAAMHYSKTLDFPFEKIEFE
ncbi:MAG: DUF1987 domain-containing protein [Bacteroidota bacterium]|nr:DUF1987 domain-containing protein [Bacteroidota bacterium]